MIKTLASGRALTTSAMVLGKNLACVLHGKNDLRMEEREVPVPKAGQVLIKMHTVGICGTDVHFWTHGSIGPFKPTKPMITGHESGGVVTSLGPDVKNLAVGDRVAIEPGIPCRKCHFCKCGRYNLCASMDFFALPPTDGLMRQYVAVDADYCFKIPDSMTMEEAALMEPLSVAVHACRKGDIKMGYKVLILGAGPIGVLSMLTAKAMGATQVIITDIVDDRLAVAKDVGADDVLNVRGHSLDEVSEMLREKFHAPPDVAIECSGVQSSLELGIKSIIDGGRIVLVALGAERVEIPILEVVAKEIDLCGVIKYTDTWPTAIELVRSGKIKLDKLTRARYKLEQAIEGFQHSKNGDVIKVFVNCVET